MRYLLALIPLFVLLALASARLLPAGLVAQGSTTGTTADEAI